MRIEDLRVFSVVAETRSLHRASQKLGVTQSAVTKILQRLEAEFGIQLVDRGGRGAELTTAGRVLLKQAVGVREVVAQTYAEMAAARSASSGKIRVGVAPSLLESSVLPLIAGYTLREKALNFVLKVQVSTLLLEELKDGELDLAFGFIPEAVPEDLQVDDFGRQRYHIVARVGHPLAADQVVPPGLQSAEWLLPAPGHGMRQLVDRYFEEQGLGSPKVVVETDASTALLTDLIRNSNLLTVLTDRVFHGYTGRDLVALPYETGFGSRVGLFYRRKAYMAPAVNSFRAALNAALTIS